MDGVGGVPVSGVDLDLPNAGRMYDYLLGGSHNFAADRHHVRRLADAHPLLWTLARQNRAFLRRVVRACVASGVRQFLDLGAGVPGPGAVHEVAHQLDPGARVAYVDVDPVVIALTEQVVRGLDTATATCADLREPDSVLAAPGVERLLDLRRPVAVLAMDVLLFVPEDAAPILDAYRRVLAPGSVIAFSHNCSGNADPEVVALLEAGVATFADSATPTRLRSREELTALLRGLDVVGPGLVPVGDWPERTGDRDAGYVGAVARLPPARRTPP